MPDQASADSDSATRHLREDFGDAVAGDDDLFETQAELALEVNPRLDGEYHALFENGVESGDDIRRFVNIDAQAMTGPVREIGAITGGSDDIAGGLVDIAGQGAGDGCSKGGLDGAINDGMDLAIAFRRRAEIA